MTKRKRQQGQNRKESKKMKNNDNSLKNSGATDDEATVKNVRKNQIVRAFKAAESDTQILTAALD